LFVSPEITNNRASSWKSWECDWTYLKV